MTAEPTTGQVDTSLPTPTTPYEQAFHAFLEDFFEVYPIAATAIGYHRFDDQWGDPSDEGRLARIEMLRGHQDALRAFDDAELSAGRARSIEACWTNRSTRSSSREEVLREDAWDPLSSVYALGSGLFALLAREFAPWQQRGAALLGRLRGIPAALAAARTRSTGLPGRPVSLLHLETALAQLSGHHRPRRRGAGRGAPARRRRRGDRPAAARSRTPAAAAKAALTRFAQALDTEIRGRADGDGRLGAELFGQKLRFTLASDLLPEELLARARRDYAAVRAEMVRIARDAWATWVPDQPLPDAAAGDEEQRERDGPARARRDRPRASPAGRAARRGAQAEVRRIEAFCREHERHRARRGPAQGDLDAGLHAAVRSRVPRRARSARQGPGPATSGSRRPTRAWAHEATESYLREDNDRMLRLLCIHEGVPGHYLQLAWPNRSHVAHADDLHQRHVRRGLGGLRDPGDDGPRLRRPRTRR